MNKRLACAGMLLVTAAVLAAPPVRLKSLNVGPTTYTNVTVLGANLTDLYFTHAHGIANAKLKNLSPELQKKFNYDANAAAEAEKKLAEDDARYQQKVAIEMQKARGTWTRPASTGESLADPLSEASLVGRAAPELQIDKWLGKKPELQGKFVLLSFWATWSVPSKQAIAELNALEKKFTGKLVVVGLSAESEAEIAAMTQPKLEYASALDNGSKLTTAFGVRSVPCVALLDPKGVVRYVGHPAAVTEKRLQALLQANDGQ